MLGTSNDVDIAHVGTKIDTINVKMNYKIIEIFSGGLYSSPNKAFEELICNSYDAFADTVSVYVPYDLTQEGSFIWVCDNGEAMDQEELKELWNIGYSKKRDPQREQKRPQIGKFGIGKLATFVLANRLTYLSKKRGKYLATTMDYSKIKENQELMTLEERELSEEEAKKSLDPYVFSSTKYQLPFQLFGSESVNTWTLAILTELKPKATEIQQGKLKWILETALPLSPGFKLYYNGSKIESSKINMNIRRSWIIGKDDLTAKSLEREGAETKFDPKSTDYNYWIDFPSVKGVHGQIDLYDDSLDRGKSANLGRSHGIFLMVRGRLINIDDPLLGMAAFSHGPFNSTRITIYADDLDQDLTSTRESIKEGTALAQVKHYIQRKFDNEVKKFYFEDESKKESIQNISYRLSKTPLTLAKSSLYKFVEKYFDGTISSPTLIELPPIDKKDLIISTLKNELTDDESIIKDVKLEIFGSEEPIAKLDLVTRNVKLNMLHPFISNYSDNYSSILPLQIIAITEVLTEIYLYELDVDESIIKQIMRRRDKSLRTLSLSYREGSPLAAQILNDSVKDSAGLEDAVSIAFSSLGFETSKIGGNGEPDGIANAILGYDVGKVKKSYSIVYDAKSSKEPKISAATAKLSAMSRFKETYKAEYGVVIANDFDGSLDEESAISIETKLQKITAMRANDLIRLLLLAGIYQIGTDKLRDLFETAYTPDEVHNWIKGIESGEVKSEPFKELLEVIYSLQKEDIEPPRISVVRYKLNDLLGAEKKISTETVESWITSLTTIIPGYISIEGDVVGVKGRPESIMKVLRAAIEKVPSEFQEKYLSAYMKETS